MVQPFLNRSDWIEIKTSSSRRIKIEFIRIYTANQQDRVKIFQRDFQFEKIEPFKLESCEVGNFVWTIGGEDDVCLNLFLRDYRSQTCKMFEIISWS